MYEISVLITAIGGLLDMCRLLKLMLVPLVTFFIISTSSVSYAEDIVMATWGGKYGKTFQKYMIDSFREKTGHNVKMIFGGSLTNKQKIASQRDNPQVDVIMLTGLDAKDALRRGLTEALDPQEISSISQITDIGLPRLDGKIVGAGMWLYGMGILYRTDKIDWEINSWDDLWDSRLKRKVALPTPKYAQSKFIVSINRILGGPDADVDLAFKKIRTIGENAVLEFDGSVALHKQFAQGETWIAPVLSITAAVPIAQGVPARFVVPKEGGAGGVDGMALVNNSSHRDVAVAFINHAIASGPIGQTCAALLVNCVNKNVPEDPNVLLSRAQVSNFYEVDELAISTAQGGWLERWAKEISPLVRR